MKRFWNSFWFGLNPLNWFKILSTQSDSNCSGDCNQGRCCDCKNKTK